jgi:hypothetical protein
MTLRMEEAVRLAKKVAEGSIVQQATERLIYQIVEVCAEHERERHKALVEALRLADKHVYFERVSEMHAYQTARDAALKAAGEK